MEYRLQGVDFKNYKLLCQFPGILWELLGLQYLDTAPLGAETGRNEENLNWLGGRGCQTNAQMVVSSWQRVAGRRGGWQVAVFGTPKASGINGRGKKKNVHPTNATASLIANDNPTFTLYIWFISPPSIQEDNGALKNPVCIPLLLALLTVCAVNVHSSRFMLISSHPRADGVSEDWVVTGTWGKTTRRKWKVLLKRWKCHSRTMNA